MTHKPSLCLLEYCTVLYLYVHCACCVLRSSCTLSLGVKSAPYSSRYVRESSPHPSTVKVISCYETGLPYCLDPYTLNTLGPDDLGGNIRLGCCAVHFRLDTKKNVSVHVHVHVTACDSNKLA